jgi:hypothetical protein
LGENGNAKAQNLGKFFKFLDYLTVNTKKIEPSTANESSASTNVVVDFGKKVNEFVRHLKRELIYSQSEKIIR